MILASILLWFGSANLVVRVLGTIVAFMGFTFIYIAFSLDLEVGEILKSSIVPGIPNGSEILVMGLIGTTIVPYNLFLGSGLSKGKNLKTSRIGLAVAISIGGIISIAILIAGTLVTAPFNFEKLSSELTDKIGPWSKILLGFGLFAAGFTSSITAPLAAVFTMKSIFPNRKDLNKKTSFGYKSIWGIVMISGLIFGFLDVKPIPAIILAQAINGILLPFIACFILVLAVLNNGKKRIKFMNFNSVLLSMVVYLITTLGLFNLLKMAALPHGFVISVSVISGFILIVGILYLSYFKTINRISE